MLTIYLNRPISIHYPSSDDNQPVKSFTIYDKNIEHLDLEPYDIYIEKTYNKSLY